MKGVIIYLFRLSYFMKKFLIILIITILCFILVACKKDTIKIGFIADLSSKTSQLGVDARNGIELGVTLINEAGGINGHPVVLVVKDDEASHEQALRMHQEFKDENVAFVIGHLTSDMASVITSSQGDDLLFISPSMATDNLSNIDDYFLRTSPISSRQGDIISRYLHKKNIEEIVVAYDLSNEEYTKTLYDAFENYYVGDGYSIKGVIEFNSLTSNMEDVAEKIISYEPDDVFLLSQATDTGFLVQKLKLYNQNLNAYSVSWSMTNDLIETGGAAVENTIFIGIYIPDNISKEYQAFSERYNDTYNVNPTFISVLSYDAFTVLVEGISHAKKLTPDSVKEAIIEIKDFKALQEGFSIDQYGDNNRAYMLYRLQNGEFVPLRDW